MSGTVFGKRRLALALATLAVTVSSCLAKQSQLVNPAGPGVLKWEGDLGHRFLASVGKRGFLFTVGSEGVEGYLYPFQVFDDLRVSFQLQGNDNTIEGHAITQNVTVTPAKIVRRYAADGLRVTETLFVPVDQPALVLMYEVQSERPLEIHVRFRPDLDLMWPGGIGGQGYSWNDKRRAFQIEEPSGSYRALIGSPEAESHSDPMDRTEPWNDDRELSFVIRATPHKPVAVIATVGMPKGYDATVTYTEAAGAYSSWLKEADAHYRDLQSKRLQINTGDVRTDQALAWSTVALDQAEGCNPDLGCGLLAGYGPTWPTRRPQYAWFFAGDGLLTTWALEAEGAQDELERALSFLRKFQNPETGAMWHEISQSATYIDWFHRYPYIYRHTDISPLYLLAMQNIWRSSGDRSLLQTSWPSLEAAWRFCRSHLDSNDGLLVIPPEQSGVNENEADRTEKELSLEMVWAAGAEAFSELAAAAGQSQLSQEAHVAALKAKVSLREFWDAPQNYYFEGLLAGGRPFTQEMASPAWGVWQGLFPPEEGDAVLKRLAEPTFLTPWGLRSMPSDSPNYQPDSYAHGSVWPLTTSTYVLATLTAHQPEQAWPMWRALVDQSFIGSPGHMPEVLSGASYRPLDVSVPEQTWSSAALMTSTVRGVLGLDPDVPHNTLRFEPHFPPEWTKLTINNFRFGERTVAFEIRRSSTEIDVLLVNDGTPFELDFAPMLPPRVKVKALLNGRAVQATMLQHERDTHVRIRLTADKKAEIRLLLAPEWHGPVVSESFHELNERALVCVRKLGPEIMTSVFDEVRAFAVAQ